MRTIPQHSGQLERNRYVSCKVLLVGKKEGKGKGGFLMAAEHEQAAKEILAAVGGADNVVSAAHCAT
ncbi:MAG: PTS transporter subunit EIIB, partial [Coriobacteriales bacterium]|nr:PTS transporter subunit EIIB [Coriobacteriales bacterium]